jgi:hypothetical protein
MKGLYKTAVIFAFLLSTTDATAQTEKAFYLYANTGINMPGLGKLNDAVKAAGFLSFGSAYFSRGGGIYTIPQKGRLASFFNFTTYSGSKKEGTKSNWVRSTQVGTSLGIVVKKSGGLQIIPFGGLNYSFFGATVSGNSSSGGSFGNYFLQPANEYKISSNQFIANAGLHIAKIELGKSRFAQKLALGARLVYYIPLGNNSWKTNDVKLSDGPNINAGGFNASFIFGIRQ